VNVQDLREQLRELCEERERLQDLYSEAIATHSPRHLELGQRLDRVTRDIEGLSREIQQALSQFQDGEA
jgi:hypothetical protein